MKRDVLVSGKTSFKIEVPYKLIESGDKGDKPLIVYLHGFCQNINLFQKQVSELLDIEAYHLLIQGPYPIYDRSNQRKVEDWGRAWYLYDGNQAQFKSSMEHSSEFIQELIENLKDQIGITRLCLFGYSMGAYLAGYFTLSRQNLVNELIMVGGRLKTELFADRQLNYDHLNVLALHGSKDKSVKAAPQRRCVAQLKAWGANGRFIELEEGHKFTMNYRKEAGKWLRSLNYK